MAVSGFIDSLKLVLSDSFEISDSGYKTLSDILMDAGLSDRTAFDTGLVQIISLLVQNNLRFPISLAYMRELWKSQNITYNFAKMLSSLLRAGFISLRKVSKEVFDRSDNITKTGTDELIANSYYVVVYGTAKFNPVLRGFKDIVNASEPIHEGTELLPKKYKDLLNRSTKVLKDLSMRVSVESFVVDNSMDKATLSLVVSGTSKYKCGDKEIQKIANKRLRDSKVEGIEAYSESDSEVFIGLELSDSEKSFIDLANKIYSFMEELELQGV